MSEHFRVPGKHSGGANQTVELRGHELKGYCTIFMRLMSCTLYLRLSYNIILHKPMKFTNIRVDVLAMYFQVTKVS
jgi:hypothetical protein